MGVKITFIKQLTGMTQSNTKIGPGVPEDNFKNIKTMKMKHLQKSWDRDTLCRKSDRHNNTISMHCETYDNQIYTTHLVHESGLKMTYISSRDVSSDTRLTVYRNSLSGKLSFFQEMLKKTTDIDEFYFDLLKYYENISQIVTQEDIQSEITNNNIHYYGSRYDAKATTRYYDILYNDITYMSPNGEDAFSNMVVECDNIDKTTRNIISQKLLSISTKIIDLKKYYDMRQIRIMPEFKHILDILNETD